MPVDEKALREAWADIPPAMRPIARMVLEKYEAARAPIAEQPLIDEQRGWPCKQISVEDPLATQQPKAEQPGEYSDLMDKCYSAFGIGKHAGGERTLLANIKNAARRSCCLSFIEGFLETVTPDEDGDCPLNWGDSPEAYLEKFKNLYNTRPMREIAEVTEAMCDRARWFILARDANIFTWEGLIPCIPSRPTIGLIEDMIAYHPKDHITKSEFAECVYVLMSTEIEGEK
jgi:hypothetical protein